MASRESKTSTISQVGTQTSSGAREAEPTGKPKRIDVEIRAQRLSVRSNHDPEFVRELAAHIDGKVAELQKAAPAVSLSKLLMLASMTVAEELFEARQEIDSLKEEISERTDAMLALLEQGGGEADTT